MLDEADALRSELAAAQAERDDLEGKNERGAAALEKALRERDAAMADADRIAAERDAYSTGWDEDVHRHRALLDEAYDRIERLSAVVVAVREKYAVASPSIEAALAALQPGDLAEADRAGGETP